jgi:hypothetical protein
MEDNIKKNLELKDYVRNKEYKYPINISEDGKKVIVFTYMAPKKTIEDFHDLCNRIDFGVDPASGYLFHRKTDKERWEAKLYGPINSSSSLTIISGFNPSKKLVEVVLNGEIEDICSLFDKINEGELITPEKLEDLL